MATPAQVANDMTAHANYWDGRDKRIARACRDAARIIRALNAGERVDGRAVSGIWGRLLDQARPNSQIQGYPDFDRARATLEALRPR